MVDHIIKIESKKTVTEAIDALQSILVEKGAMIVARVNHGTGGKSVDLDIGDSELLIFGNPKLGTPLMMDDQLAGLFLPLKVLGYSGKDNTTWLAYQDPAASFGELSVTENASLIQQMQTMLKTVVTAVA